MFRDQADRLRELVRHAADAQRGAAPRAAMVAVSSGRLDEGATTLVRHLGRQLVRMGQRVVLVDADLTAPRLTQMVQAQPGALGEVLQGRRRAVETLTTLDDRLQLLAGRLPDAGSPIGAAALRQLTRELASLGSRADVVLVDAGAGMSPWIDQMWQAAGDTLLVCQRDVASLRAAYQSVKLASLASLDGRVRLVVNACDDAATIHDLGRRLGATCEQFLSIRLRTEIGVAAWEGTGSAYLRSVRTLAAELLWENDTSTSSAECFAEKGAIFLKPAASS